jgi:hypothetical protein
MVAKVIPNVGAHTVEMLDGDEYLTFRSGSQGEKQITAANLRKSIGGDVAAPRICPENGGGQHKLSDFPNSEFDIQADDRICGIQNGRNVNFTRAQIAAPLIQALEPIIAELVAMELERRGK